MCCLRPRPRPGGMAAVARCVLCAGTPCGSHPVQSTPTSRARPRHRRRARPQGAPGSLLPEIPTGLEAATFGAWLCLGHVSNNAHMHTRTHTYSQANRHPVREKGSVLPFTICLCLFSQLFGWSFLCRTTWLLWSRLVRSYHAVEIMAFSRWRFLMICSWAACGKRSCVSQQSAHQGSSLPRGSHGVLTCCSWVSILTPDPSTADIRMRMTSPRVRVDSYKVLFTKTRLGTHFVGGHFVCEMDILNS